MQNDKDIEQQEVTDAIQQFEKGVDYYKGRNGKKQDRSKAVMWYRKSAEQGYHKAQFSLGYCYNYGKGVTRDFIEAVEWYQKAVEQGNAYAQYNLGVCYNNGEGVVKDKKKAIALWKESAKNGYDVARITLERLKEIEPSSLNINPKSPSIHYPQFVSNKRVDNYDIFISYCREDGVQYAHILQLELQNRGYHVFLDHDELTDGIFGEKRCKAIEEASIFIAILSPHYLDRCTSEHDWVRGELLLAIKLNKYFIPINPDNKFLGIPAGIPDEIVELIERHQQSGISFGQYMNASIDMMIKNRIASRINPTIKQSWWTRITDFFVKKNSKVNLIDVYRPQAVEYDIFISYRRVDGRDVARNIQQALKAHGYKHIFFDYDSIQKGEFNKRIIDAIYSCTDFILVLSPKSMKRCTKNGDPVANEIRTAIKYKKNIIPVTIDGKEVKWPRAFPNDLKFIRGLQFHDHKSDSYFDHSIDELCEKLTYNKSDDKM